MGHDVEFVSTDGVDSKLVPKDLEKHIRAQPSGIYDAQISYTAPHNWPNFLGHGSKNRFGIWNYEYNNKQGSPQALLVGFAKYVNCIDKLLPSSNFSMDVFKSMLVPQEKMVVIPHGFDKDQFDVVNKFKLKSNKKYKILLNIAQPHLRKNIYKALESYALSFSRKDDVCLVAKVYVKNNSNSQFDVDFYSMLKKIRTKYPNCGEIEVVTDFIEKISDLYYACDVNFSTTHVECWHLPSLEALAAGIVNVVPRYGGILDFCDDNNSLLTDGVITKCPREHQYWQHNPFAVHFEVDINDSVKKLKQSVYDNESLKEKFALNSKGMLENLTWDIVTKNIMELVHE
jgi:glycosyltransferase involved in cell wall biosynthesis